MRELSAPVQVAVSLLRKLADELERGRYTELHQTWRRSRKAVRCDDGTVRAAETGWTSVRIDCFDPGRRDPALGQ